VLIIVSCLFAMLYIIMKVWTHRPSFVPTFILK
jgi:hypothetical protein